MFRPSYWKWGERHRLQGGKQVIIWAVCELTSVVYSPHGLEGSLSTRPSCSARGMHDSGSVHWRCVICDVSSGVPGLRMPLVIVSCFLSTVASSRATTHYWHQHVRLLCYAALGSTNSGLVQVSSTMTICSHSLLKCESSGGASGTSPRSITS